MVGGVDGAPDRTGGLVERAGVAELVALVGVVAVAVVARFWGLQYGLPHSFYPDESSFMGDVHRMARTGDLRPAQFLYPSIWFYVLAACLKLGLAPLGALGAASPLGPATLDNPTYVYGVGRAVTALAGVASIPLLYLVGRRAFAGLGVRAPGLFALLGAGFLALSPLAIQHAKVASPDVPTTALAIWAAYCALRVLDGGGTRWYALGGLAIGLAAGVKYPSAMLALVLVAAHLRAAYLTASESGRGRALARLPLALFDRRLWLAGAITVAVFFATSPYILIDWGRFSAEFESQARRVLSRGPVGEVGVQGPLAPVLYLPLAMAWGLDLPVALLALVGLGSTAWMGLRCRADRDARSYALVLLVFPLALYLFSWTWQHRFARYVLPLIPFGCLLAALGVARVASRLPRAWPPRRSFGVAVAVAVAATLWQADGVVRYDALLTRTDTRRLAADWMAVNLPPNEPVLVEWYGPSHPNVRQMGFDLSDRSFDRLTRGDGPRYVATSSFTYDRWLREPEKFPKRATFYGALDEHATLLHEVRPDPLFRYDPVQEGWDGWHLIPLDPSLRPGPVIRVYRLPSGPSVSPDRASLLTERRVGRGIRRYGDGRDLAAATRGAE